MRATIKDLLESMLEEYKLDNDCKDDLIHDYADRILDVFDEEEDEEFYFTSVDSVFID